MTRLRDLIAGIAALVRGEPVLAATLAIIAGDLLLELRGDGLSLDEIGRIVVTAVLGVLARTRTTPVDAPAVPALPTNPPTPAPGRPVLTLSGWRR